MTYENRVFAELRAAEALHYEHPWPIVLLLVKAVVLALLTIATAVNGANRG